MSSLKHLVRETGRVAWSWPPAGARRGRRIARLLKAALSANAAFLPIAAALIALAVTGVVHDLSGNWSPAEWVALVVAVVLVLLAVSRRGSRPVRILSFKNLVAGDDVGELDKVAAGFAELLHSEIERISELVRQEPFITPADVLNPAGERGEMVLRSSARVPFKSGVAATGLHGDIKETEIGTVALGPLQLQVGTLLTLVERTFGRTLQGSLVETDGVLRVVASQSGHGGRTWSAQTDIAAADVRRASASLARELAHRIELERPGAGESGADVDSFQRLVDGLESYQRFQREGLLHHLDAAEEHFRAALSHSPGYAAAYHNLGLVYREQRRIRTDIGLRASTVVRSAATLMWQKAVALDPTLAPARIQLARAALEQAEHPDVGAPKRAELLDQAAQSARSALRQSVGGHPMDGALASYWLAVTLLLQEAELQRETGPGREAAQAQAQGDGKVREALRLFRRTERDLVDERARRLVEDGDESAVQPLTERIAHVIAMRSECWFRLAGRADDRPGRRARGKADRYIRTAIRWAPDMAELHALRGRMLQKHHREGALFACLEAIQRDPQNHHIAVRDVGLFAAGSPDAGGTHELATALFTVAAHQHPDDAEAWLLLAVNQMFWRENRTAARALAGMALALEPGREDVRRIVDAYWPSSDGSGGAGQKPFTLRWARAWAHAREAQQHFDEVGLREALAEIESLRGAPGASAPEVSLAAREIGLLHGELAGLIRPSDRQRRHWAAAVEELTGAVREGLPAGLETPPQWNVELGDAHAALGDSLSDADHRGSAGPSYRQAIGQYDLVLDRPPKTVCPRYRSGRRGQERLTELSAEPPDLPTRARALAGRAAVYVRQGRTSDAVRDCRDALKLAPLYAYPRFTLARLYRDQRAQYDLAEQTLLRLIELLPAGEQRDLARLELAVTRRRQADTSQGDERTGLLERAREELVDATREASLSPDLEARMHEELAHVLDLLGRCDDAIVALRSIGGTARQSGADRHHEWIAHLIAGREQPWEVEQELLEAQDACAARLTEFRGTDEEPPLRAALVILTARLAMFYAEQGIRLDEARLLAEGALQSARRVLEPSRMAVCEDACGWVAFRQGRLDEAVDLLQDAVEHSGGHAQQWARLARALEARDDPEGIEGARDIWQQIAEQFPHSGTAEQARRHLDLLTQG
ncbi:tetratricopeptide repeat protein [Streptomyces europaeiscabiei]|uniref:tetratricopeptide repeat protein n=1 Tax=Streptomyces europaeiscabiei TaxID=146819 RepID=UPI0029AE3C78|nr:tetratricopeptide repeat protein [Streptomyces europaeiscabiei]MDX3846695.1 tetratricopeptide repeat protein [Streptomyces europaeiscabiei]MDX3865981.1 tetratricopeptide repeat protein [Streptomyces europaeiscabiei]MDX3875191.1 tetratricopeptide repeat protein [Streptomyces europaeiscabiei]